MAACSLSFSANDNPLAHKLFHDLSKQGVTCTQLDQGYSLLNFSGKRCPKKSMRSCHVKTGDGHIEAQEVIAYTLNRYGKYRNIIEGALGDPLPWVLDDLDPKTTFDAEIRARITATIRSLETLIQKLGFKKGTEDFKERMAVGLYMLVTVPDQYTMYRLDAAGQADISKLLDELNRLGLAAYRTDLQIKGGLRPNSDLKNEYTALQALERGVGDCTEGSKILFAIFQMAGLDAKFVLVESSALQSKKPYVQKRIQTYLKSLPLGIDHVLLELPLKGQRRLFDPSLLDSDATHHPYYPFTLRHYLSLDYGTLNAKHTPAERMKDITKALALDPSSPFASANRGYAWLQKRDWDKAIQDLKKSIHFKPNTASSYVNVGLAALGKGDLAQAIQVFAKFLRLTDRQINQVAKWATTVATIRWDATPNTKKISETFTADTKGLGIGSIEGYVILAYSLWHAKKHTAAVGLLKDLEKRIRQVQFKKKLSHSTKLVITQLLRHMPKTMRTNRSAKKYVRKLRSQFGI